MNARTSLLGGWLLLGLATFVLTPACSDDTATDDDESSSSSSGGNGGSSSGGKKDASTTPPKDSGTTSSSGSVDTTDGGDEDLDAAPTPGDSGLVEPAPGTSCPTVGEAFARFCGVCGTQSAFCSQSHVVTGYGACHENAGGCVPDASTTPDSSTPIVDSGTPIVDSGTPVVDAGPPVQDAGPSGLPVLTLATTVNTARSVTITSQGEAPRVVYESGTTCPLSVDEGQNVSFAFVEVHNPNATAARIDVQSTGTADTWLAVYATLPTNLAAREDCLGRYDNASCGSNAGVGAGCLTGSRGPVVPAGGSVFVYVGEYSETTSYPIVSGVTGVKATVKSLP